MICTQCKEDLEENNATMEMVGNKNSSDEHYVIKWYYQEPRQICMMCFAETVLMFQRS